MINHENKIISTDKNVSRPTAPRGSLFLGGGWMGGGAHVSGILILILLPNMMIAGVVSKRVGDRMRQLSELSGGGMDTWMSASMPPMGHSLISAPVCRYSTPWKKPFSITS